MATLAQSVPKSQQASRWLWEFLKQELARYPGRVALVARMLVAATLVMIITMTFRIPYGAYATLYALTTSRESPRANVADVKNVAIVFVIAASYELIGAMFFVSEPLLRLVWLIVTFFVMFYALRVLTNYTAAVRFGYLLVVTTPLWDQHLPADARVEGTLWAVFSLTLATAISALVGLVYAEFTREDNLVRSIAERLRCVEQVVFAYAEGRPIDETTRKNVTRLTMVGMSQLRRTLQTSSHSSQYREQMGAVLALVSRLVDIAANLVHLDPRIADHERESLRTLAKKITGIRSDLEGGAIPRPAELQSESTAANTVPLFREMAATVSLIPEAFVGSQSLSAYAPLPSVDAPRPALFRPDALSNFEHIKFGLKGCLAASLCYIIYNVIDWPGISTAVTTCLLTALTTIGSSRQKQVLRIAGAIVGGVALGMGAQIFILPHLDSIADFTVLFLGVSFIAAWFSTSSARLSYFGDQIALGFYLINLQEFRIQTSLAVARDRVFGILLGLFIMWLVFDQIWGAPAVVEMKKTFVSNLRLLARFAREPLSQDLRTAIEQAVRLRETINTNLDKVRALADGVLLEFGPTREQDLALRNRIRQWQTQVRMIFITTTALWKYRMHLPGFQLPETIWRAQGEFDEELATTLDRMADRFEGKPAVTRESGLGDRFKHLEQTVEAFTMRELQRIHPVQLETLVSLSRRMQELASSLDREI
jgi:multidrug resistance protein MdtO